MPGAKLVIQRDGLQGIISGLAGRGYRVIGPTPRDGAIVYDSIALLDDLPVGWTDHQDAGRYRIERLWQARRDGDGFSILENEEAAQPLAFIGVRACELRAITIQDRVFLTGQYLDKDLQDPSRARLYRRGQLRRGRRHLLLRFDGRGASSRDRF